LWPFFIAISSIPKNLSDSDTHNAITSSFSTWNSADINQIFNYSGATNVKTAKLDGTNAILFARVGGSAIAVTYVWYYTGSGELVEVDTVFNKRLKWAINDYSADECSGTSGRYDLQNIATHEFGHWIGLGDLYGSSEKDLTMYGYGTTGELKKDTLGTGDINGALVIAP